AQAAVRAGWRVAALDLFADADLQAICPTWQLPMADYPHGFVKLAKQAPPGPWLYTGGLENYPEVVAAISKERELLGNNRDVLLLARDPFEFRHQCFMWALPYVSWYYPNEEPTSGTFIRKPRASAGGRGITLHHQPPYPPAGTTHFWEDYVPGQPQSAVYLGSRLLGVTEQLIGTDWTGGSGFQYCGSIGPCEVSRRALEEYGLMGVAMLDEFDLRGLFGVDTVLHADGLPYPIELNPRYTASIEILERALPIRALPWHLAACRRAERPDFHWNSAMPCTVHGKAILFARDACRISDRFAQWCQDQNTNQPWPLLADLPHPGTLIEPGQPVLTYFTSGGTTDQVRSRLRDRANELYAHLASA
ncbi:MAG TPA: ATP-grasp domain-containing protein, partial [Pirellulaceae bacterium]|nr:ATP-grasp domain-containing protein [Pirellulaceae bacterium]